MDLKEQAYVYTIYIVLYILAPGHFKSGVFIYLNLLLTQRTVYLIYRQIQIVTVPIASADISLF